MTTAAGPPQRPPARPRRFRRRLGIGLLIFLGLSILVGLFLPWLLLPVAKMRLEREAGSLRIERFVTPRMPPGSPGPRLLAAGAAIRISKPEQPFVKQAARGGLATVRSECARIAVLLERNREALRLAQDLGEGPSSLNIDYTQGRDVQMPNLFLQIEVGRLVFLEGLVALEDRDPWGAMGAFWSLGRQAEILEAEPDILPQLVGLGQEKFQRRLLILLIRQGPRKLPPEILDSLRFPGNDLRERYRVAVALDATTQEQGIRDMLRKRDEPEPGEEKDDPLYARAARQFAEHWSALGLAAAALDRYRLFLEVYEHDYRWMHRVLHKDPKEMGFYEKSGLIAGPTWNDLPARYRAAADSRELVRTCLQVRFAGRPCQPSPGVQAIPGADGSCTLRTIGGEDYLRFFVKEDTVPEPQECVVP